MPMEDDASIPIGEPKPKDDKRLPPLSLIELMIATAVMACVFAFQDQLAKDGISYPTDNFLFKTIQRSLFALSFGIPFASIFRLFLQKRHFDKFFLHPEHWVFSGSLVLNLGFFLPLMLGWFFVFRWKAANVFGFDNMHLIQFGSAIASVVAIAIYSVAARNTNGWWKACMVSLALSALASLAFSIAIYCFLTSSNAMFIGSSWLNVCGLAQTATFSAVAITAAVAVTTDLRTGRTRELWHWIGVLQLMINNLFVPILSFVFYRFVFDPSSI